jgi:rRNA processing protein Gar1
MPAGPTHKATTGLPTTGYALIVDGRVKTEFMMQDHALKAARELKGRLPMLQVKIYDAENKRIGEIELAAA